MHPVIIIGIAIFLLLAFLLARYAPNPRATRARLEHPEGGPVYGRMSALQLRSLVTDLMYAMGYSEVSPHVSGEERFVALRRDPFRDIRYVVFLEASPPGDVVEQPTVVALAEAVKSEGAQTGLLITPYAIDRSGLAGLEVPVELIDGARLRELVAAHMPERIGELDRYHIAMAAAGPVGRTGTTTLTPEPSL